MNSCYRASVVAVLLALVVAPCAAQDTTMRVVVPPTKVDTIPRRVTLSVGTITLPFSENGVLAEGEIRLGSFVSIGAGASVAGRNGATDGVQNRDLFLSSYEVRVNLYPQKNALRGWVVTAAAGSSTLKRDALLCSPSQPASCPDDTQTRRMIVATVGHQWILGKKQRWVAAANGGLRAFLGDTWRPVFDYPDVRPVLAVKLGIAF